MLVCSMTILIEYSQIDEKVLNIKICMYMKHTFVNII